MKIIKIPQISMQFKLVSLVIMFLSINGCSHNPYTSPKSNTRTIESIKFTPLAISRNNTEKKQMRVSKKLIVTYEDGTKKAFPLSYKILAKMGDAIGNGTLGMITNQSATPILKKDGSKDISENPDGNSLINIGDASYLITHMEEQPGTLYKTKLQVKDTHVKAVHTEVINLSSIGGTVTTCASTQTNYGSHLGGEEDYSLNSIYADKNSPFYIDCALDNNGNDTSGMFNPFCSYIDAMSQYLGDKSIDKNNAYNGKSFSLYNYGYIIEVQPKIDGSTKVAKHYVTGKYTPELAVMMPDGKTIYMSDDGNAKGFWKFVSDTKITEFKNDWEGTLYSAKVKQTSAKNGGKFELSWIRLGHAKDSDIKAIIDSKKKLSDIFRILKPNTNGTCAEGFTKIYEDNTLECLQLIHGEEKAASFLETRKYAAYLGATTEFRKEEGITYNKDNNKIYMAMSQVDKSMEDNYKGEEPINDIKLPKNICGNVYEISLDNNYNAINMKAVIGGTILVEGDAYANEWLCSPESISNPDNLAYIGNNILIVSEDTKKHVNNMSWAYNTKVKTLTRIASLPIGAEVTGVKQGVISDQGVLFLNVQHPFIDNPKAALKGKNGKCTTPNSALLEEATDEELKAIIGYIDGIPAELFEQ